MNKLPLLLTASICTHGMSGACFTEKEREKMYLTTLLYYKKILPKEEGYSIIFAENSDWDLTYIKTHFENIPNFNIVFYSIAAKEFDIDKGKGYNEILLMNKTIERAASIHECKGFVKATGRYPIYNIRFFIDQASKFILNGGGNYS